MRRNSRTARCNERSRTTQPRPKTGLSQLCSTELGGFFCSVLAFCKSVPFPLLCLFCHLLLRSTHTSVQSESSHSLGQSSFFAGLLGGQFGGQNRRSREAPGSSHQPCCLQRTRCLDALAQVLEHWGGREQTLHVYSSTFGLPIPTLALAYCRVR